jgi:hypothetical protein
MKNQKEILYVQVVAPRFLKANTNMIPGADGQVLTGKLKEM